MDDMDEYIWQRRIQHGVRYQKSAVPFPDSVGIGLDFNAALERMEKLDLSLLTNAVMLELCEFAKAVTKSETYFLFEILDFNFDLGVDVDNDQQYYDYARRAHNKIKLLKEQIKVKPQRWKETFPLPDLSAIIGVTASKQSRQCYPKRNKMLDFSVLSNGSNNRQSAEHQKTESNRDMYVVKRGRLKPTENTFLYCKNLGVTPIVRPGNAPREKLDPSMVTNGVMLELLNFSRVLCGTHTGIIYDLVKQNFGHELDKTLFRMQLSKLMERKYACLTPEEKDAFRKEPFEVQTQAQKREYKRKRRIEPAADYEEQEGLTMSSKRRVTPRLMDDYVKDFCQDGDLSYMCPVDFETEMQSGSEAKPETMMFESSLSETEFSLDVKEEEEEVVVSPVPPQTCLPGTHSKNTTLKAFSALFSEDNKEDRDAKTPKQKLWLRRTTRAKQILKSSKVNDLFARCREIALDFNVGSGSKQDVDPFLLTNHVMLEIYRFATTMSKSFRSFLFEILDINFNLVPQGNLHNRNFIYYMITKEKILQIHPDRWKTEFLSSPFQFPEVYNMVDVTSEHKVETEQPVSVDSAAASAESQEADMELHPYCKKFGLNLWSIAERPANQKLDLTALTTGAVLELFGFVRELCAPVRQIVNDVLEHNFDLDLQSEASVALGVIKRWYSLQKSVMKGQSPSPKVTRWLNTVVPINGYSQLNRKLKTANGSQDLDSGEDVKPEIEDFIADVKTEETEDEKINSYNFCEEIGLILDVGSKPEANAKLDLRLLTRGILFEMHRYVERNCNRYVPALYEILEYNFDLSSQNHRRVEFAWSIASQVIAIAAKNGRKGDYLNTAIELPIEVSEFQQVVCKEEPEDGFGELDYSDNDIMFVRELKPVDIEVEIE